jgi:chromosome segregation ATPase
MDITKLVAKIQAEVSEEDFAKIKSTLKNIEGGVSDLIEDVKTANSESKKRKIKIRELEETIDNSGLDKESYDKKLKAKDEEISKLKEVETKYTEYQTTIDKTTKDEWSKVAKVFEADESDANFERISKLKANYKFGEDLEMADIRENLKTYKLQESAGGFKDIEVNVDDDDPAKKTVKPKVDDPLAAFDN